MRRNKILVLLVCLLLTGCGGYATKGGIATQGNRNAGTEHTVSGSAVSESTVSGGSVTIKNTEDGEAPEEGMVPKREGKKYRFRTDTNVYYEERAGIRQMRLDGTQDKRILRAGEDEDFLLYYVDENWLYYEVQTFDNFAADGVLYRVPLQKDVNGCDVVNESAREELLRESEPGFENSYWDSRYMIYRAEGERIVTYDLQKKETCSETPVAEFGADGETEFRFFRLKDSYAALVEPGAVYVQKPGGEGWQKCEGSYWAGFDVRAVQSEKNLFFAQGDRGGNERDTDILVWKCDGKKVEGFVTNTQMEHAVREAKEMGAEDKPDVARLDNIFTQDGRLYLQIELGWYDDKAYRMEYVLLTREEDETELCYEKTLTECMQSHGKSQTGSWRNEERVLIRHVVMNDAQCVYMMNGHAYFSLYDYGKENGRMGCYDFCTGKFGWVTEREAENGELSWEGAYDDEDLSEVFGDDLLNPCTGFSIEPAGEKMEGEFHETK